MKKPFFPPLIALFPIISLYSANVSIVPWINTLRPALICVAVCSLVWLGLSLALKDALRAGIYTSIGVLGLLEFAHWGDFAPVAGLPLWAQLLLWTGLLALVGWGSGRLIKSAEIPNILGLALVGAAAASAAGAILEARNAIQSLRAQQTEQAAQGMNPKPDVFYIIVDGYGRADALKRAIGCDNTSFVSQLESKGFYVASQGRSNYCQTELSLASSLNMDYLQKLLPPGHASEEERGVFQHLVSESRVESEFEKAGYLTVAVTSGFPSIQFPNAAVQARTFEAGLTLFESAILQNTPLRTDDSLSLSHFTLRRDSLRAALDTLENLNGAGTKPRLILAHVLAPHPPFVIDANGNDVKPKGGFGYWDGSDYMEHVGTRADYAKGYAGQLEYLNGRLLNIVDRIIRSRRIPPIIIIQGDHGSKKYLDQNELEKTDLKECFPNLNAFWVPQEMRFKLYPSITPVNSFRLVMNQVLGTKLPLLEDHTYYSPFNKPRLFTDVTNRSQLATVAVKQ